MSNERMACRQFEKDAEQEGYLDGFMDGYHQNPYVELSPDWVDYETGYDRGIRRHEEVGKNPSNI